MRILLDENVPVDILPVLHGAGIEAESVNFIGWKRLQNGELIVRAREQFNLLLTRDKDFDEEYLKNQITVSFGDVLDPLGLNGLRSIRCIIHGRRTSSDESGLRRGGMNQSCQP